jgi:hypothetical protein
MAKIKLTEKQIQMLQMLDNAKPAKKLKITKEQAERLFEGKFDTASYKVSKSFKKGLKSNPDKIKIEQEKLTGHPIAGDGGPEYYGQSEEENEKTHKAFNESLEGSSITEDIIEFLKEVITNPKGMSEACSKMGINKEEAISVAKKVGLIRPIMVNGESGYEIPKESFKENLMKMREALSSDDIKATLKKQLSKPEGTKKSSPEEVKAKLAAIRAKELERRKTQGEGMIGLGDDIELEEDNYPMGAANDPRAPYNQKDTTSEPTTPQSVVYDVVWMDNGNAILNKGGELFLYTIDSVNDEDYAEYAERETSTDYDEDGPYTLYSDEFDVDSEVIERFINDNLDSLQVGVGISGYEDGYPIVKFDEELNKYWVLMKLQLLLVLVVHSYLKWVMNLNLKVMYPMN